MFDALSSPKDYLALLARRRWHFLIPASVAILLAAVAAFVWPPTFRSAATILIEEPDIPRDFVISTIGAAADQRVQVITQRVMTTQNLIEIINKYDLYPEARRTEPITEVVDTLREDVAMELISADIIDPRRGLPTKATIAFQLSFDHANPRRAQQIANELVSLYLGENLRDRRERTAQTTDFLEQEAERLNRELADLEARLAVFKRQYSCSLPEQRAFNLRLLDRNELELFEVERREQTLSEQQISLRARLSQVDRMDPRAELDPRFLPPDLQLKQLRSERARLLGRYGTDHPDVKAAEREIAALSAAGASLSAADVRREINALDAEIIEARKRMTEDHPEMKGLLRQRGQLEDDLARARSQPTDEQEADNPAYITLAAQLETIAQEIVSFAGQKEQLKARQAELEACIAAIPEVEREYTLLTRNYENTYLKHQEVKSKQLEAELAESVEAERKGERFSLIEPPLAPTEPVRPNRPLILALGVLLAGLFGGGAVVLAELFDSSIHSAVELAQLTGMAPLVALPYIANRADKRRRWLTRVVLLLGIAAAIVAILWAIETYYQPLDVLYFRVLNKLDTL